MGGCFGECSKKQGRALDCVLTGGEIVLGLGSSISLFLEGGMNSVMTGVVQKEGTCWYQLGERNDWYFLPGMTTWFLSVWTRESGPFLSPFITLAMSRRAAVL